MPVRLALAPTLAFALLIAPLAACAQGSVPQTPPVPARAPASDATPPGTAGASDAAVTPPDRIASPATSTAGPGLMGGGAGAPLTGAATQQPARPQP